MKKNWPVLSYQLGKATYDTLQLFTQVAGKIKLATLPWTNHSWNVSLHITPQGLSTRTMPYKDMDFEINFDLIAHQLIISTSKGETRKLGLQDISVASFYEVTFEMLLQLGIELKINTMPSEIENAIPFELDELHHHYDPLQASLLHQALLSIQDVFMIHRSTFIGKSSPIHLFWGGFDVSLSFFSGRKAPHHPGRMVGMPDWVLQDAYSHEVRDAGFWAGSDTFPEAAFYCYQYPAPAGYKTTKIQPEEAYYHEQLGEFILPYADVQQAENPEEKLLAFLESTYAAGTKLAKWDPELIKPSAQP